MKINLLFIVFFGIVLGSCSLNSDKTYFISSNNLINTDQQIQLSGSVDSGSTSFFQDHYLDDIPQSEYAKEITNFSDFTGSIGSYVLQNITSTGYSYRIVPKEPLQNGLKFCFDDKKTPCINGDIQNDGSYMLPFGFDTVIFPRAYAGSQIGTFIASFTGSEITDNLSAYFTVYDTASGSQDYRCLGRVCIDKAGSMSRLDRKLSVFNPDEMHIIFDAISETASFRDDNLGGIDYLYTKDFEYQRFMGCGAGAYAQMAHSGILSQGIRDIHLGKFQARSLGWQSLEYTRMMALWGVGSFTGDVTADTILSALSELRPPIPTLPPYIVHESIDTVSGMPNAPASIYALNFNNVFRIVRISDYASGAVQNGLIQDLDLNNKFLSESFIAGYIRKKTASGSDLSYEEQKKLDISDWKIGDDPIFELENIGENYAAIRLLPGYEVGNYAELCKPAIYDYSLLENQRVLLQAPFGARFTKLIPDFTEDHGWRYNSLIDGNVLVGQQKYPYLYYSIKIPQYTWLNNGVVVRGSDMERFFEKALKDIGFRDREKQEFIDYWKNEFEVDKLYTIAFRYNKDVDLIIPLSFEKSVSQLNRVLLEAQELSPGIRIRSYYEGSNHTYDTYIQPLKRSKNDVFEWGGTLLRQNGNIVTH